MNDLSALSLSLTYAGTLGVAMLIFVGQPVVFATLLILAGSLSLLAWTDCIITGRRRTSELSPPDSSGHAAPQTRFSVSAPLSVRNVRTFKACHGAIGN